jgi:hypothetical protein
VTAIGTSQSAAKKAPQIPPDPTLVAIQNLSVLPIVDARAGEKKGVDLGKLQEAAVRALKHKHYPVSSAATSGEAGTIAVEDLEKPAPAFISKLGPKEERWVMVICLDDAASKMTFGSTGSAEVTGYVFDKDRGESIWRAKGIGQIGQGGLMGMAMKGAMKGEALNMAVLNLIGQLQARPKPPKK